MEPALRGSPGSLRGPDGIRPALHRRKGQHVRNFNDEEHGEINVPPTLVSFAVDVAKQQDIITPEFKRPGSKIVLLSIEKDEYDLPCYHRILESYGKLPPGYKGRPDHLRLRGGAPRHGGGGEQDGLRKPPGREDRAQCGSQGFLRPRMGQSGLRGAGRHGGPAGHHLHRHRRGDGPGRPGVRKCVHLPGRGHRGLVRPPWRRCSPPAPA